MPRFTMRSSGANPTLFLSEFEDIEKRRPEFVSLLNASCARSEAFVTRYDVDLKDNKDFITFCHILVDQRYSPDAAEPMYHH